MYRHAGEGVNRSELRQRGGPKRDGHHNDGKTQTMPSGRDVARMQWLDAEHTIGIVTVEYK